MPTSVPQRTLMNDHDVFILVRSYSLLLRRAARRSNSLRRTNKIYRKQNVLLNAVRNDLERNALENKRLRIIIDALIRKAGGEVIITAEEAATAIPVFFDKPIGNDLRLMTRERYIDPNVYHPFRWESAS